MKRKPYKKKFTFLIVPVIASMLLMFGCEDGDDDNDDGDGPVSYTVYAVLTDTGYSAENTANWKYSGNTTVTVSEKIGDAGNYDFTVNFTYNDTSSSITIPYVSMSTTYNPEVVTLYNFTAFIDKDDSSTFNSGDDYYYTENLNVDMYNREVTIDSGDWLTKE